MTADPNASTENTTGGSDQELTRDVSPEFYREGGEVSRSVLYEKLLGRDSGSSKYVLQDQLAEVFTGVEQILEADFGYVPTVNEGGHAENNIEGGAQGFRERLFLCLGALGELQSLLFNR